MIMHFCHTRVEHKSRPRERSLEGGGLRVPAASLQRKGGKHWKVGDPGTARQALEHISHLLVLDCLMC